MDAIVLVVIGAAVFVVLMAVLVGTSLRRRDETEAPGPPEPRIEDMRPETLPSPSEPGATSTLAPPRAPRADVSPETIAPPPPQPFPAPPSPPPPPPQVEAPPRPPKPKRKALKEPLAVRMSRGLTRSRQFLTDRLTRIGGLGVLDDTSWDELEEALIEADVGVKATVSIVGKVRRTHPSPDELVPSLKRELVELLSTGDRELKYAAEGPSLWLITGVNGTGKTTSIAKIANRLADEGRSVVLAAADTFRAAAIDQLGVWADRLGVHMVRHAPGADPGAVVFDALAHAGARGVDVVLVDTAGRLHTKGGLMEELKKVRRVAERQVASIPEVLLVLDATVGQNGIAQAKSFREAVDLTGIVLTKMDGTARGGIIVAVQQELGIPVKLIGVGEDLEDLEAFEPEPFVDALLSG